MDGEKREDRGGTGAGRCGPGLLRSPPCPPSQQPQCQGEASTTPILHVRKLCLQEGNDLLKTPGKEVAGQQFKLRSRQSMRWGGDGPPTSATSLRPEATHPRLGSGSPSKYRPEAKALSLGDQEHLSLSLTLPSSLPTSCLCP